MAIQLLFGVTDKTSLLLQGSVSWKKAVNQSWSASFTLYDPTGTNRPSVGQPITIKEDGTVRFTGFIDQFDEQAYPSTTQLMYVCQCVDWTAVTDRRSITAEYDEGEIMFNVIQDINTRFLSGEGINSTTDVDGSTLLPQPLVFNPSYVRDAFNQIRDLTGRQWWIDESKNLHFQIPGNALGGTAPFTLSDNDGNWINGSMKVNRTSKDFRNVQIVKTNTPVATVSKTEIFTISQINQFFVPTTFKIDTAPTVTVNGVSQTIFQFGVDAFGQNGWYWTAGGFGVQQGQQITPALGSIVAVTYDAQAISYVTEEDAASIAARAAIEGGSGIWTNIANVPNVGDATVASNLALGMLDRGTVTPSVVTFDTLRSDFVIGERISVNITMHGLSGYFTIQQVNAQEEASMPGAEIPLYGGTARTFRYQVTISAGSAAQSIGDYVQWYQRLLASIGGGSSAGGAQAENPVLPAPGGGGERRFEEEPAGALNGSNKVFTLTFTPSVPWVQVFLNGVRQSPYTQPSPESAADYTLVVGSDSPHVASTITFRVAPKATDELFVEYWVLLPGGFGQAPSGNAHAIPGLFSTGIGGDLNLGTPGTVDPHWILAVSPDLSHPGPAAVIASSRPSNWHANLSDAQWIAPEANPDSTNNTPGVYTWRITFDLTGFDPSTAIINGNYCVDDTVQVKLNGTTVIAAGSGHLATLTAFSITTGFIAGVNTFDWLGTNNGLGIPPNPTGLLVEITSATAIVMG